MMLKPQARSRFIQPLLFVCAVLLGWSAGARAGAQPAATAATTPSRSAAKPPIRVNIDPTGKAYELNLKLGKEFEKETGIAVEFVRGPADATERLAQYLALLGAESKDVDVLQVDVIWPATLAEHLVDLGKSVSEAERAEFFPEIVKNNTVGGALVCLPWFADAGILYYRTDLLKEYGYSAPPKNWDELEAMAQRIKDAERASGRNKELWGFVFQGKGYEGLTCNAIEWIASQGGGRVIEEPRKVTVKNDKAIAALARIAKWPGTIAPPGVVTYGEEEARRQFQAGGAVFMRNWPYAYALGNADDSPIKGKFDVAPIPGGAAALGGWQLGVSKYSARQADAIRFVKWMTSAAVQKRRAVEASLLPTRPALYDDKEVAAAMPFIPAMREAFLHATPRPATAAGADYNECSTRIFKRVHAVLTKEEKPEAAIHRLDKELRALLLAP